MRGRIRNILGDVLFAVLLFGVMFGVLLIGENSVRCDEKECLTTHEN